MKNKLIFIFCIVCNSLFCQKKSDELIDAFTIYRNNLVLFSDLGFSTSPYSLGFKSSNTTIDKLKYKNNLGVVMGVGGSYKWFAIRLAFALSRNLKPINKYGKTNYVDLGVDFPYKKMFFEFDFRNYNGYAIKNADAYNNALLGDNTYEIRPHANTLSIALNGWFFNKKDYKMDAMKGKIGHFNKQVFSWYVKGTFNVHGITDTQSIIPAQLTDSLNSKTMATTISAFDFGALPGVAYANKYRNWQYAAMLGFGPVIQSKFYIVNEITRGFFGLAPRYDLRITAGYNVPKWFLMMSTEFDNRSIRFDNMKYKNNNYTVRLTGGIRLDKKEKKVQKRNKKETN